MRRHWIAALLLALILALSQAAAAELAGPQLDAAGLRAARGAGSGFQLRLVFDLRRGDAAPAPLIVLIGIDYVDIAEGGRETLYDFRLRRRLALDRASRVFANFSLYGDMAFRRFELEKRVMLAQMFAEAAPGEAPPLSLRPFWVESDLGLSSGAKAPAMQVEKLADGALRFRADGQEAALFAPASQAVPEELRKSFAHFLRARLPLHPTILAAIEGDGRLPQRLVFVTVTDSERRPVGLVLRKAGTMTADYPLPETFEPRQLAGQAEDQEAASLRGLLPLMLDAAAGRRGNGPRSLVDYRRAVDQDLRQRRDFAAAMLLAEMALQYGTRAGDCTVGPGWVPCHGAEELGPRLARDRRAAVLYKARTAEPKEPEAAVKLWESLKREEVPNGYVIDAFLADRLSAAGHRQDAMGAFAHALEGNPYLAGVYKELGDHFLRGSRTELAWICYDLGRALPGRDRADPLADVDELEQKLAAAFPDFF